MDAIARKRIDSYWTQSETYEALRMYIDMNLDGLKESIIDMLSGKKCKGYSNVVFIPKRNCDYPVMVVELKWNKTAKAAIERIKDRKYPAVLEGLSEEILLVGINYDEKTKKHSCKIERWKSI